MKRKNAKRSIKVWIVLSALALFFTGCSQNGKTSEENHVQDTDFAMGTVITQNIYSQDGDKLAEKVLDKITEVENIISWRIDSSQVAAINEAAGNGEAVEIDQKLGDWLLACQDVYEKSDGALDITVGPAARLWDIGGDNPKVATREEIDQILPLIDGSKLWTDGISASLSIQGGQLDLGAVGKGIACDEIADLLDSDSTVSGTFSVGGSVLIYGQKPDASAWKIGVQNPRGEEGENMGVLTIEQNEGDTCFVSTSGDYEKYIEEDGVRYHHIMDPKTGAPAKSGLISVTILSDSGFLSDALSTACFVAGPEDGMKLAETYGVEAVFIDEDKQVTMTDGMKDYFEILDQDYQEQDDQE
jgi:thiamine biosynthesis lipoprotein